MFYPFSSHPERDAMLPGRRVGSSYPDVGSLAGRTVSYFARLFTSLYIMFRHAI